MNLASLLVRSADCYPALVAVARGTLAVHSYASLARRVTGIAAAMREAGLLPGDRVLLLAGNCPEYVEVMFAAWHAGVCVVPVNARLHAREAAFILQDCTARWAFVDVAWRDALSPLAGDFAGLERAIVVGSAEYRAMAATDSGAGPLPCSADDPAWLFYTSGTTGAPKGVVLSHDNLLAMCQCFLSDVETVAPGDANLHPAPMSHGSGLYVLPHVLRAATNVVPESGGFHPEELCGLIEHWPGSLFFAAPTMVKRLVESPRTGRADLRQLKSVVFGGGPMYVEDLRAAYRILTGRLAQIYGQGESPMTITAMPRTLLDDAMARDDGLRLASVGVAQTGVEIRIGDPEGPAVPQHDAGEVLVRGRSVMRGYWRNPEATAATLASGWLHTGDVGTLDRRGFLTLKDRSKDLIISGGANIYPREVEEVLLAHPRVAEAAVVGRAHADWGEEVTACVVSRDGQPIAAAELDALCLDRIARFKRPRAYVFLPELPKNETGKVLKTALRRMVGGGLPGSTPAGGGTQ